MSSPHVGDVGTIIEIELMSDGTAVNLSSATVKQIKFRVPKSETVLTRTASFTTDGTDGKIRYVTVAGDLYRPGDWKYQGYVETPTGAWHSDVEEFTVKSNLE